METATKTQVSASKREKTSSRNPPCACRALADSSGSLKVSDDCCLATAVSNSLFQELVLKIIDPVIALIVENVRVDVIGLFESAAAGLELRLESGNLRMRREIVR